MVVAVTFELRRTEPFGIPVSDDPVDEQIWTAGLAAADISLRVLAGEPL